MGFQFLTSPVGHNGTALLSKHCRAKEEDPAACLTPKGIGMYTSTPVFLSQSEYDLATLRDPNMYSPSCEQHPPCVNAMGSNMTRIIKASLLSTSAGSIFRCYAQLYAVVLWWPHCPATASAVCEPLSRSLQRTQRVAQWHWTYTLNRSKVLPRSYTILLKLPCPPKRRRGRNSTVFSSTAAHGTASLV